MRLQWRWDARHTWYDHSNSNALFFHSFHRQNAGFSPAEIKARAAVLAGTSEGPIDPAWKALERWEGEESLDPELFADVYARYQEVRACVRASLFCGW